MVVEFYDALKDAGASEEKARAAASATTNYKNRFNKIEADLLLLKWMVGVILGGVLALISKAFF